MNRELEQLHLYCQENPNGLTPQQLAALRQEFEAPVEETISDECLDFKLWCRGYPSRQEAFAAYIEALFSPERMKYILEVGGGRDGRLSRLLAKRGYHMTCIDPELELESGGGVTAVRAAFDYRSAALAGYDCVVAQEPCEAAEHIVWACTSIGMPFVIALCGVPHRLISGREPEDVWEWYDYLRNIDREHTLLEVTKLYHIAGVAVIRSLPEKTPDRG